MDLDAWGILYYAEGHTIEIVDYANTNDAQKLYFVNLGGYDSKQFTELHKNIFIVANNEYKAKSRALDSIVDWESPHKDYLFDIDKILDVSALLNNKIRLTPPSKEISKDENMLRLIILITLLSNQAIALPMGSMQTKNKIIIWDNDGTITGSANPNDKSSKAKVILPGVKKVMEEAKINLVVSGFKSPESEAQNFDPYVVIDKFTKLMDELPISAAAFSPAIGGIECYVVLKKNDRIAVLKAHEDPRYHNYIGKFKKPDIGMFQVIKDIASKKFGLKINGENTIMIGDTWHDQSAAESFGIPFIHAATIHGK